jgi:penicillin-binding protein 1A
MSAARVEVENLADGGLVYWLLKLYAFTVLTVPCLAIAVGCWLYVYFSRQLPAVPDLSTYAQTAPSQSTIYAQDGTLLAELATERREIVPLARIPQPLIDAFLATEDRRFFSHGGMDVRGTLRALWANLHAGQVMQGGSTITQQVAKAYLSSERTLTRKIREAIFARRLEARYSKREILALYLNHIFLGANAYGVQAAARRYFDKDLAQLDVGEMALIGGLARAPSRDSPLVSMSAARARRNTVLDNMVQAGMLASASAQRWKEAPLVVRQRPDMFKDVSPYFAEQVRRELIKRYGQAAVYTGGYRVETSVLPWVDVAAQENVDHAVRKLDKRQGWRGAEARLKEADAALFRQRAKDMYGARPLEEGRLYLGLVEKVADSGALVRVGARVYGLPLENMSWAAPYSASEGINDRVIEKAGEALRKGDVIWVRWAFRSRIARFSDFTYNDEGDATWMAEQAAKKPPKTTELMLEQTPRVSGAIYTFDHQNGYVLAMAGGDDFDSSEFNRVVQACRQPGSAYKPIYYSLALDRGYAYETLWNDKPKAEVDPNTGELWIPQNVDGSYTQQVTLERALVWSKNPPSVEIFHILGAKEVEAWAHRLGIASPLITSPKCEKEFCSSLALGASCMHMDELTRAFAVFARNGRPVQPVMLRRVIDRAGRVVEDHTAYDDPWLDADGELDRAAAQMAVVTPPVIDPRTAYLTSRLLREIVTMGHSGPIRAVPELIAAGKTGTSSHTSDVWFIGYTSRWMTSAWIGDDTYQRELGTRDASFMLSVPMWARYMAQVTAGQPLTEIPWDRPPSVKKADTGGPLKEGFAPPPAAGFGVDGKPIALPDRLVQQGARLAPLPGTLTSPGAAPSTLVRQKTVRVQGAPPRPPKPGEAAPAGAPSPSAPAQRR